VSWVTVMLHTGCFDDTVVSPEITRGQLFDWEVVMTFTLISVVYACGVAKPGHGSFTPLAVGLSLVACAGTGGSMEACRSRAMLACIIQCMHRWATGCCLCTQSSVKPQQGVQCHRVP
jgi:hypothetical protein